MLSVSETAERLGISATTVKDWHHAGLLSGKRFNDKGECLYDPPGPNSPTKRPGIKLASRAAASSSDERHRGGAV